MWSQAVLRGSKEETEIVRGNFYGDWIKRLEPEYYRMCWYVL